MIGSTLQKVSRARSNTSRPLALFLTLSVFAHGLYFSYEWIILGFVLSGYILFSYLYQKFVLKDKMSPIYGLTDAVLLGMSVLSLMGIFHPVKVEDGLIEALKWGIVWLAYRLGTRIAKNETAKLELVQFIEWLAVAVALVGWLPWVSKVEGRLSSVFGYSNATAAFLGAALLLYPWRLPVRLFLVISLLSTGSRAGVGLFLAVLGSRQVIVLLTSHRIPSISVIKQRFPMNSTRRKKVRRLKALWYIFLGSVGIALMLFYYRQAWENLSAWGFTSASWQERLAYFKDGLTLARQAGGYPQAGGWMAFPTVQHVPYWSSDPHSSFIHCLLGQGIIGILILGFWSCYQLVCTWKSWKFKLPNLHVWAALLFLAVHSLVDADFSFGSLGLLFWLLFGSFQQRNEYPGPHSSKWKLAVTLKTKGALGLSLMLFLVCGSLLINPGIIGKGKNWNVQARQWSAQDPNKSLELWNRSLNWDQTQIDTRREQAELLLKQGNIASGLKAVEEVLHWQSLDLKAYEWAQSVVWDTAERQRNTQNKTAVMLYRWVEGVPQMIEEKGNNLTASERLLWKNYRSFLPSEHIKLLADFARQRQLTQSSPRT